MHSTLSEIRKFVSPEFIFGMGTRSLAARYASLLGARKILVVSDEGVKNAGWTDPLLRQLREAGFELEVFLHVTPNPRDSEVMEGSALYKSAGCNFIIAIGGGSPIDCAKGIGIVTSNPKQLGGASEFRQILEFEGIDQVDAPVPPLICIPTTAATGADLSQFAIITDVAARRKFDIVSKAIVPDVSLIDPEVLVTLSDETTAHTGIDALSHAIEAYVSTASSAFTDLMALEAIRVLGENLVSSFKHPKDVALRSKVMFGGSLAGLAFSNASLGLVHAMSHQIGGWADLPHGLCCGLLLETVIRFNASSCPSSCNDKYAKIAEALCPGFSSTKIEASIDAICEKIAWIRGELCICSPKNGNMPKRNELMNLAELTLADSCIATNPVYPTLAEVIQIYESVFQL